MKNNGKLKTFIAAVLTVCCVATVGCGGFNSDSFNFEKTSGNILHFSSSDEELDTFLNDYFHRHLRYDDYSIGNVVVGAAPMYGKHWDAMSLYWFDATDQALGDDRFKLMENSIESVAVDKYGYVWQSANVIRPATIQVMDDCGQGWFFPNYAMSDYLSRGWEFNEDGEEIRADFEWYVTVDGEEDDSAVVKSGLYQLNKIKNAQSVCFETIDLYDTIDAFQGPYIDMDIRIKSENLIDPGIEDIYIWWQTEDDKTWSEDKCVSQKEWATIPSEPTSAWVNRFFFPMFLNDNWGREGKITRLRVEIRAKPGRTFSGEASISNIRATYDNRHALNNANFLTAAKLQYEFTGNVEYLKKNITRYRQAIQFMLVSMNGESGLVNYYNYAGHDSVMEVGRSIPSSYWDMLVCAPVSMYTNTAFVRALEAMAYLEDAVEFEKIPVSKADASVYSAENELVPYTKTAEELRALADEVRENLREPVDPVNKTGFWLEEKNRFIEGFDADGVMMDHGYLEFNLEAIEQGVPTHEQAEKILAWVNGDVQFDDEGAFGKYGDEDSGSKGIYDYEFAPRNTTLANNEHNSFHHVYLEYGDGVQNGGAIMFVSYYDIISRIKTLGADNGFQRLSEIKDWYMKIYKYAERVGVGVDYSNYDFYRVYYEDNTDIRLQGDSSWGDVGLDIEFLESSLLYAVVPFGFFGISSPEMNVLQVKPNMPEELDYWTMENLYFKDIRYSLSIGKDFIQIDSVRGIPAGKYIDAMIEEPTKGYKVFVDGVQTNNYKVENGRIVVRVPFRACKITVK